MLTNHPYPGIEEDLRRVAVEFSTNRIGPRTLAILLRGIVDRAEALCAKCGAHTHRHGSDLVCELHKDHPGAHNTAADGTGDEFPAMHPTGGSSR